MMQSRILSLEEKLERLERCRRFKKIPVPRMADRSNPLEAYDEVQFLKRFHMRKETVMYVFELIKPDLDTKAYKRGLPLPPLLELCIAIRFYATDSHQLVIADLHKVNQSTVSKVVLRVSTCIAKHATRFIKYPNFVEAPRVKADFFEIGGFPGVVGCIDCTHAQIQTPGGTNAELFRNRKGVFSLNIQAICDAHLAFTDIVIRWYGSCHDSRIFDNSVIKDKLETKEVPGILLGDGGYACTSFLMTPLLNPQTQSEKRYNVAQIKTRNTIERAFGVWKRRFPCLRMLRIRLDNAITVTTAVAALHNICRRRCDLFEGDDDIDSTENQDPNVADVAGHNATMSGRAARAHLIASHF